MPDGSRTPVIDFDDLFLIRHFILSKNNIFFEQRTNTSEGKMADTDVCWLCTLRSEYTDIQLKVGKIDFLEM